MNFWPTKQNIFYLERKTTCCLSTTPQAHTWKEMFSIIQCLQQCFIRTGLPVHGQIPFQSRCKQPCSLSLSLSPPSSSPLTQWSFQKNLCLVIRLTSSLCPKWLSLSQALVCVFLTTWPGGSQSHHPQAGYLTHPRSLECVAAWV